MKLFTCLSFTVLMSVSLVTSVFAQSKCVGNASNCAKSSTVVLIPLTVEVAEMSEVEDEILVGFHANIPPEHKERLFKDVGGSEKAKIEKINVHVIKVNASSKRSALDKLKKHSHVRFAEPNGLIRADLTPTDPYYASAWHLPKVSAPAAWDLKLGDPNLVVAVADSGVDPTHPDLAAILVPGWNFYDNNADTSDIYGHGTKVAGTIGALMNNGVGVVGLAASVKIMPFRITDSTGWATWSALSQSLIYATDHGARVYNASFGGTSSSSTLQSAIDYAFSKNVAFFASAGNSGNTVVNYPAGCNHAFAIAATDSADNKSSFSNYGTWITLSAPGSGIYTTVNGGGYGAPSGTSFASPLAAAGAALALSVNPSLDIYGLKDVMLAGTDDLGTPGFDAYFGYGRMNARKIAEIASSYVSNSDTQSPAVLISSPVNGAVISGPTYIQVSASDNRDVAKINVFDNGTLLGFITGASGQVYWSSPTDGAHTLSATAFDVAGNSASAQVSVTVPADTLPPSVTISKPLNGSSMAGVKKVVIQASATDNRGISRMELFIDGVLKQTTSSATLNYTWSTLKLSAGAHVILVKACDLSNLCSTAQVTVNR